MVELEGRDEEGIAIVPLSVGANVYAVRRDVVATVLEADSLGGVDAGAVIELSDHEIAVVAAADVLGEDARGASALVVFHGRDDRGRVPGWLVDRVGATATVEGVERTVGAVRHVKGRVEVDGETAVLVDPLEIHCS